MPEDTSTLECLVRHWTTAKKQEEAVRFGRIVLEEKIAALVPGPDKGQKTVTLADGTKVTVERGFNYKADCKEISGIFNNRFPNEHLPIKQKTTYELDVPGYEWYRDNNSEIAALLSECVTVTPKKTAVSVKVAK